MVLGHEVVGDVVAVGAGVERFAPGDRLVVAHHVPCFACHYCRRGSVSMCRHFKRINLDPGGFAELVRVPAPNVEHAAFCLPPELSDEAASFTEPLACCLRAVKRTGLVPGDTALVVGLGSIGCLLVQLLTLAGASAVLGDDVRPERRALGRSVGARVADDPAGLDGLVAQVSDGRGVDCVVITAGGPRSCPARPRGCATAGRSTTSRAGRGRASRSVSPRSITAS